MPEQIILETISDPRVLGKLLDSFFGNEPLSAMLVFVGAGIMLVFFIQFANNLIALLFKKDPSPIVKRVVTGVVTALVSLLTVVVVDVDFSVSQMMFWTGTIASLLYRAYMSGLFDKLGFDTITVSKTFEPKEIA